MRPPHGGFHPLQLGSDAPKPQLRVRLGCRVRKGGRLSCEASQLSATSAALPGLITAKAGPHDRGGSGAQVDQGAGDEAGVKNRASRELAGCESPAGELLSVTGERPRAGSSQLQKARQNSDSENPG